ncbi:hypothetical protein J7426_23000 [Tropicibacter sp. R16_0]|uniref:hypothetical protein n=1 Tax=Tropicibacter sp. R16_0 TaxID=2821102 RepID=UPI001ADBBC34|nr:hypothetical protein [Tropicibacter sp. R16_0]MBO9453149.1 hypothetical protein [Tropicibacter sp. R16_0]
MFWAFEAGVEMWNWIKINWERVFLFLAALVFLAFSIRFLVKSEVSGATAAFVMFFLCLVYGNVSRFKRFKGLGIEAELWEDKQKEANDLIDRLKSIVQVYTDEIVMTKVMAGRFGGGSRWPDRWALYEELVGQHDNLGQKIDFLPLKEKVYRMMVFDAVAFLSGEIHKSISLARRQAHEKVDKEFGSPIKDHYGYEKRCNELRELKFEERDLFEVSKSENVAHFVLSNAERIAQSLRTEFGIELELPSGEITKLKRVDELYRAGDFRVDPELVKWADREV